MVAPYLEAMPGGGVKSDLSDLVDVGKRLWLPSSSKDALCDVLEHASELFSAINQSPSENVLSAMSSSMDALVQPGLLRHKDKDVRLLVATCISEVMRIVAPDAPYSDEILKEIFELIVASFKGLNEKGSRLFDKRLKILETVASVRSCVVMLDLECDDLIREMFQIFFTTVSEEPIYLILSMRAIMCLVLEESEDIPLPLLEVLLRNLLQGKKGVSKTGYTLARVVFEKCVKQLRPHVEAFLASTITDGKLSKSKWRDSYHDLIFEISKLDPISIEPLVPKLIDELQSDKSDLRLKAVRLVGCLLVAPKGSLPDGFKRLFAEYNNRFSDTDVDVRLAMTENAKQYLLANPSGAKTDELLAALSDCLQDENAGVRAQVVVAICDYAKSNLERMPIDILKRVSDTLQSTEVFVRLETFKQLTELYRTFCSKKSEDATLAMESCCWIPSKLIGCCSDTDPKEFRVQAMETVFAEQLFPIEFSVEDRVKCWMFFLDAFEEKDVETLEKILLQKQRFHNEMRNHLAFLPKLMDEQSQDNERQLQEACKSMANAFVDPSNAELQLVKLSRLKDIKLFKALTELLDPNTTSYKSICLREELLNSYGDKGLEHEFVKALGIKCSFGLFGKDHTQSLIAEIVENRNPEHEKMVKASMNLFLIIGRHFPSLLEGLGQNILDFLKDDRDFVRAGAVEILARIGGSVPRELWEDSNSAQLLEKFCVDKSRKQAKYAVQALAAMSGDSCLEVFTPLYGKLMDLLHGGSNLPTTLQSLGCIAQQVPSICDMAGVKNLENFLLQDLFRRESASLDDKNSEQLDTSEVARIKIFGLKTLVRTLLPIKDFQQGQLSKDILESLLKFLERREIGKEDKSSDHDKAHLRLAAAIAVLRLSNHYNSQIMPQLFQATILCAKDPCSFVKHKFLGKVHKLLMDQAVPAMYVCAFVLSSGDGGTDSSLEEDKQRLADFVKSTRSQTQAREHIASGESDSSLLAYYPEYVLFYLVHTLAQEATFPSSGDGATLDAVLPLFRQLYLFIWALLSPDVEGVRKDGTKEIDPDRISLILAIFYRMKSVQDVVEASKTEITYMLADIGIAIIKDLLGVEFSSLMVVENIPLPSPVYTALMETTEGTQKVDRSYLPDFLGEEGVFSQLKAALPFSINVVLKKQGKRKIDSSLEEEKHPPQKRSKVTEVAQEDSGTSLKLPGTSERPKRSRPEKVRPLEIEANMEGPDIMSPGSAKRKRGGDQFHNENGEVSSPEARLDESPAKATRKPKKLKVPVDDVELVNHRDGTVLETVTPGGSASKRVRISIKKPKPPLEHIAVESPKKEDSSDLRRHGKKKDDETGDAKAERLTSPRGTPRRSAKSSISSGLESPSSRSGKEEDASVRDLVGSKIRVWWPMDKKFYQGKVASYQASRKKHKVVYDDGDVEFLNLDNERWEFIKDTRESPVSPSTKATLEPTSESKEKQVEESWAKSSKEGLGYKRSGKKFKSKKTASKRKNTETEPEHALDVSHDDTESVEQEDENIDSEETPAAVSKKHKSSEKIVSTEKKASLKGGDKKSDDNIPRESPSTASKDSKDSGDTSLKVSKSGRKKAH